LSRRARSPDEAEPAFCGRAPVGDLARVQEAVIVVVVQSNVLVCLVEVTSYALNSEFGLRSANRFNHRKIAGDMGCMLSARQVIVPDRSD